MPCPKHCVLQCMTDSSPSLPTLEFPNSSFHLPFSFLSTLSLKPYKRPMYKHTTKPWCKLNETFRQFHKCRNKVPNFSLVGGEATDRKNGWRDSYLLETFRALEYLACGCRLAVFRFGIFDSVSVCPLLLFYGSKPRHAHHANSRHPWTLSSPLLWF